MLSKGETVCVGLSGGVDSSVSAKRLIEQGYDVIGVFIKTWHPDFLVCDWEVERLDAMRVAAHLGIPFYTCDAEEAYKKDVADYMIREYAEGRTPNPDVMCNQYVKFGAFFEFAKSLGATKVATGHYARVQNENGHYYLYRGSDADKDQSYFLWTLSQEQLAFTIFPIGDSKKVNVRKEAEDAGLPTFAKNDSQGICFLGQVDIKEFLSHFITVASGDVLSEDDTTIGTHDGALFYTLGQRHGFTLNTGVTDSTPHYVVKKDIRANTITVSQKQKLVLKSEIVLSHCNVALDEPIPTLSAQFRYRQKPFPVQLSKTQNGHAMLEVLEKGTEYPSLGQSCVIYHDKKCLGGGIINEIA